MEVAGSIVLISAALEGPILEMPMKNAVIAITVHMTVIIPTQNHPIKLQFRWTVPARWPARPKLTEAAPIT
jgi:hypothetical protein